MYSKKFVLCNKINFINFQLQQTKRSACVNNSHRLTHVCSRPKSIYVSGVTIGFCKLYF